MLKLNSQIIAVHACKPSSMLRRGPKSAWPSAFGNNLSTSNALRSSQLLQLVATGVYSCNILRSWC